MHLFIKKAPILKITFKSANYGILTKFSVLKKQKSCYFFAPAALES